MPDTAPSHKAHVLPTWMIAHFHLLTSGLLIIAAIFRFGFLTRKGFGNLEFITLQSLPLSPRDLFVERIRLNHMPLYFEMLKGWTAIFGNREFALKFPSAVFSSLTVVYGF